MKTNVGGIDRIIRLIAGVAIAGAGVYFESLWGLVALIPLGTAAIKVCPLYIPLGLSTKGAE